MVAANGREFVFFFAFFLLTIELVVEELKFFCNVIIILRDLVAFVEQLLLIDIDLHRLWLLLLRVVIDMLLHQLGGMLFPESSLSVKSMFQLFLPVGVVAVVAVDALAAHFYPAVAQDSFIIPWLSLFLMFVEILLGLDDLRRLHGLEAKPLCFLQIIMNSVI